MRRSQYFLTTLREDPAASDVAGHLLLLRAGFIAPLASGIYSFLPMGERVKLKVEAILRAAMEAVGALEVSLPVVQPADLWAESGRLHSIGDELAWFTDRTDRRMVLAMTHEEVIADIVRRHVRSHRQLPVALFQIQTKFRDEPRARGGLIRAREFVMKDAYSCHATFADLEGFYLRMHDAYLQIFDLVRLPVRSVEADVGMMGGTGAHEFMYESEIGEDHLVVCDGCGYSANRQVATFRRDPESHEEPLPRREVATPGAATIADLSAFLGIPADRTAKAAFFVAGGATVFAVVRGDMDVNETKLAGALGVSELQRATPENLIGTGIVPGYASPIGVRGVTVVVDPTVARTPNLVAGANREGYHFENTNYQRDYTADVVADIAAVMPGAPCALCGAPLRLIKGVEVGNIFKLGTRYADAFKSTFLDEEGHARPVIMGSYGIGVGRLIACVAQEHHDDRGLRWPVSISPFHVYLVGLDLTDHAVREQAERLYADLVARDVEVLYDDRTERAGVKFNDADLLGIPIRLTVSRRTVAGGYVEVTERAGEERRQPAAGDAVGYVESLLLSLKGAAP